LADAHDRGIFGRAAHAIASRPKDAAALLLAAGAAGAILINALALQVGPHPAPIFANKLAATPAKTQAGPALPRARPGTGSETVAMRRHELVADIQKELARRGFYDGPADGVLGPKTDLAIREFEQAAKRKPTGEPSETILQALRSAPAELRAAPVTPARPDPIAEIIGPSKRVLAAQRALADFGFGQIKPTGVLDGATQAAIEKFERQRRLPVTGQLSERVVRELAAMTGRPLE
jgi:peptidoglycan hydrolase-like protein with peptidoglycan-binding domain